MTHESLLSFSTLTIVYLSSFSAPSTPSLSGHQRPDIVTAVIASLNFASSSSCFAFASSAWTDATERNAVAVMI